MKRYLATLFLAALSALTMASVVVDRSGTVATAGTSQQAMAAKTSRTYLMCQNPTTATTPLFVNIDAAAATTGGSIELAAGGSITFHGTAFIPTGVVNVTSATQGAKYVCKEG